MTLIAQMPAHLAHAIEGRLQELLADLCVKLVDLSLVDLRLASAAAFEDAGGSVQQSALSLMDHRGMNAEPAGQLGCRLLALQRLKRHSRLELRRMLLAFRHL